MPAIGIGLLWAAYSSGLIGYSLIRGYCNSPAGLLNPFKPQPWTTTLYTGTGIFPNAAGCAAAAPATPSSSPAGANAANPAGGAVKSGAPQAGVQGVVAGGHGR